MITRIAQAIQQRVGQGKQQLRVGQDMLAGLLRKFRGLHGTPAHRAGRWGEEMAERFLRDKGYKILGRRVRLSFRDELDLVARHDDVLVFVEVKTRRREDFGRPLAAVNGAKRRAMTRAALRYVKRLKQKPPYLRFDVVEVVGAPHSGPPILQHIESCFTLDRSRCIPW